MKRILFDTSVYGELIKDPKLVDTLVLRIPLDIVIYGNQIIRKELRAISKEAKLGKESKRKLLLSVYDLFIRKTNHDLKITDIIEIIAQKYYSEYRKSGGALAYKAIANDLRIVACASVHHLNIVVSHDTKSMLSEHAISAYAKVNSQYQLEQPDFIPFTKFKKRFIKND